PHKGTLRGRHGTLARVAMDAVASGACTRRNVHGVRRSRVVLTPRSWRLSTPACAGVATVAKTAASPGRARISRKAIARGKPGCPGCTCGLTRVHFCSTPTHMGLRAQSAPGFPCALSSERANEDANLRRNRAVRTRAHVRMEARAIKPTAVVPDKRA